MKKILSGIAVAILAIGVFGIGTAHAATSTIKGQLIAVGSSTFPTNITILSDGRYTTVTVPSAGVLHRSTGAAMSLNELMAGDTVEIQYSATTKTASKVRDASWNGATARISGIVSSTGCSTIKVRTGSVVKTVKLHGGTPILRSNVSVGCFSLVTGESVTVFGAGTSTIAATRVVLNYSSLTGTVATVGTLATDGSLKLTIRTGSGSTVVTTTSATQYFGKQNKLGGASIVKAGHRVTIRGIRKGSSYLASSVLDSSASLGVGSKLAGILQFSRTVATASHGSVRALSSSLVGQVSVDGWGQAVAVSGHYAYVVGTGSGMQVVDLTNVKNPKVVGTIVLGGTEVVVTAQGNYAYVGSDLGVSVVDVSVPSHPVNVGFISYVRHTRTNGWFNPFNDIVAPSQIAISGTTLVENGIYSTDYNSGELALFDVSDPTNPKLASTIGAYIGWLGNIALNGNMVYVVGSQGGFTEYNITDPYHPKKVKTTDTTFCEKDGYSVAAVFSGNSMFCVVQHILKGYKTSDGGVTYTKVSQVPMMFDTLTMSGTHVYGLTMRDDSHGQRPKIAEFDVSNPAAPKLKNVFFTPEFYIAGDNEDDSGSIIQSITTYGKYAVVLRPAAITESAPNWVPTIKRAAKLFLVQFDD